MLIVHASAKIRGLSNSNYIAQFPDPMDIGARLSLILAMLVESVFSVLLVLGILTRLVCIPLMVTMLVIAFLVHQHDPFYPKQELALMYFAGFLTCFISGGGKYALYSYPLSSSNQNISGL